MFIRTLIAAAALLGGSAQAASTLTQWNFNSVPSDGSGSTGTTGPSVGAGSASLIGGTTATFANGNAGGGSSDPDTSANDSGWNLTGFTAQGTADKASGAFFLVSTVGWQDITLSYDLRHSNTASAYEAVQLTFDGGASFVDAGSFIGNLGDTWFNGRTVDLSMLGAADNNALFGFRVVSTFAPGGSTYLASNPASSYAGTGTWRFDMVTVSALAPVPEPAGIVLMAAGLGVLGLRRRSRG